MFDKSNRFQFQMLHSKKTKHDLIIQFQASSLAARGGGAARTNFRERLHDGFHVPIRIFLLGNGVRTQFTSLFLLLVHRRKLFGFDEKDRQCQLVYATKVCLGFSPSNLVISGNDERLILLCNVSSSCETSFMRCRLRIPHARGSITKPMFPCPKSRLRLVGDGNCCNESA